MRSKKTNFYQVIILLSGIVYFVIGIIFFISPIYFGWIFNLDISAEWIKVIPNNEFLHLIFIMARSFSALLLSIGLSMVLPLFDPLKYRGLIYFTGVLFPALASLILIKNSFRINNGDIYLFNIIIFLFGIAFSFILLFTIISLLITKGDAKSGIEWLFTIFQT